MLIADRNAIFVRAIISFGVSRLTEYFASSQAQHLVSLRFSISAGVDSHTVLESASSSAYHRTLFSRIIAVKMTQPEPTGGARHITWICRKNGTSCSSNGRMIREVKSGSLHYLRTSDLGKSVASEIVLMQSSLNAVKVSGNSWK